MANLSARSQNQLIAKGRIEDADYAKETATLNKQQILSFASQMLVNAQKSKAGILIDVIGTPHLKRSLTSISSPIITAGLQLNA